MLDFQPWTIFFTIVNLLILYFFSANSCLGASMPCWSSGNS